MLLSCKWITSRSSHIVLQVCFPTKYQVYLSVFGATCKSWLLKLPIKSRINKKKQRASLYFPKTNWNITINSILLHISKILFDERISEDTWLSLFRWAFSGLLTMGARSSSLPKICHTYPAMTWMTLPKEDKKHINYVTHSLISADISIFSPEISNFFYIKKYGYRFHFHT